jgi:hypothetical protein
MAVRNMTKLLHVRYHSSVLLKVDIAKAFDTVGWLFHLDLLAHLGCLRHWTNWVSVLLSTTSTRINLNGVPSHRICHARGLRQGDPLSPMLFVLFMETLNALFHAADTFGLFTPLNIPRSDTEPHYMQKI